MFEFITEVDGDERCGILVGIPRFNHEKRPTLVTVVELPNRSECPGDAYVIWQSDIDVALEELNRTHRHLVGFWHTHPSPFLSGPSGKDLDSIAEGREHWWHVVFHPASREIVWFDSFGNLIKEKDDTSVRPAIRDHVRTRSGARVDRVRRPRESRRVLPH